MLRNYRLKNYDFRLIFLILALTGIGLIAIGSAQKSNQSTQFYGAIMGFVLMIALSLIDYSFFLKFHWAIYAVNMILLLLVQFVFGDTSGGAQRWLEIGPIRFQPSETAKIMLILFFAQYMMKYKEKINSIRVLGGAILLLIPPLLLIYKQPDLSTSIVILLFFCVILFVAGISYKIVIAIIAIAVPAFFIFISLVINEGMFLEEFQQLRILAWLHPEEYSTSIGYQQYNSIMAIGSGQLTGKGLENNSLTSLKNGNFILEPHTDFIYTVIGEELGFVGCCIVIILLFGIVFECILIAKRAKDLAGTIIASGMAGLVGFQGFVNMSVTTGLLPNTGIPLPFVSYGLTSLVSLYIGMGFVLNVRLQAPKKYS